MSQLATLKFLIDTAARDRDEAATRVAQAQREVERAETTRRMLDGYRGELQGRSPVLRAGGFDVALLAQHAAFARRLDVALGEQRDSCQHAQSVADGLQRELHERERRLRSLQALLDRRESEIAQRQAKADQKRTDEFATRAFVTAAARAAGR